MIDMVSTQQVSTQTTKQPSKYRLLQGIHDDGKITYRQGDVITSEIDLIRFNGEGAAPKFEKLHRESDDSASVVLPDRAEIWDQSKETIDQFAERMRARQKDTVSDGIKNTVSTHSPTAPRDLFKMTEKELLDLAALEEIDLKGAKGVQAIAKILKAAGVS